MADPVIRSELSEKCQFIQDVSALILKQFRTGCLCSIHSRSFARLVGNSFDLINNDISGNPNPEFEKLLTKTFLSFLSCLRTLLRTLVRVDSFECEEDDDDSTSDGTLCKHFHEWILILVRERLQLK